jgi:hypothetical protein
MSKVRPDKTAKSVQTTAQTNSIQIPAEFRGLVFVRYRDHVMFSRATAEAMQPQIRKAVGWLVYECAQYIILSYDVDDMPPTLKGGDPKASGLVLLRSDILEFKRLEKSFT